MKSTTRAAIYARFSSELQNAKSCDDQIAWCEKWAEQQGMFVVATFADEAVSGASALNRPRLARMLGMAREKRFDILIVEDLDRLARNQADLHSIRNELMFLGVSLMTVSDGKVTAMHAGLKGLMSEMFLTELGNKTRRGLQARVADGASGGGVSYGYRAVPGQPGKHEINEREAAVVRRIFADYVAGATPREIAKALNAEGIPSPRGGKWNSSTLNGSRRRANGVLQNRQYIGEIVWNRQHFIKNPATGKRVSRPNPESEWQRGEAPHLAIVDRTVFGLAVARKVERSADRGPVAAKATHILSGLTKCGCCGASYTVIGAGRIGCSGNRERGDCDNNRTITRVHVEDRVLAALDGYLADPDMIAAYVAQYHETRRELLATKHAQRGSVERRSSELQQSIKKLVDLILDGSAPNALVERLREFEAEQADLLDQLEALQPQLEPLTVHPSAAEKYRRIIKELRLHLDGIRDGQPRDFLFDTLRGMIDKVVITPTTKNQPVDVQIHGLLAELLVDKKETPLNAGAFRGALVAGAGFEPATFRL
ncbi:MAG: Recombinase [Devosia sp.]|nr:Recombinase [Devosia sp.]